jgi:hypothetical protein
MKEGFDSPTGYKPKITFRKVCGKGKSRDGAVVARRAHNPKVTGSSPVPATKEEKSSEMATFFVLLKISNLTSNFTLHAY